MEFRRFVIRPGWWAAAIAAGWLTLAAIPVAAQRGWTPAEIVSGISTGLGRPAIAVDAAGAVTVAWADGATPTTLIRAARRAPGASWTPAVTLGSSPGGADLAVAASADGGALVVWTAGDGGVYASRLTGSSGTWTPQTVAGPRPGVFAHAPALAVDGHGNAHALWHLDGVERVETVRYDAASHTWGAVVDLGSGVVPAVGVDAAGNAVATWSDRSGTLNAIRAARFTATSGVWSPPVPLDANAFVVAVDLDVAPDGTAAALWYAADSPRTWSALSVAVLPSSSSTWGAPAVLSTASPTGVVAIGSHDMMAVWTTGQGATYSRADLAAPGLWTPPAAVDASVIGPSGLFMSLAADGLGGFVAAWTAGGNGRASHFSRSATAWAPSMQLNAPGVSVLGPTAVMTPSGTATVAWRGEVWPYGAVQAAQWDATLAAPTLLTISPNAGSLTVDFTGPGPTLAEFAAVNVEYSLDGGTSWIPRAPPSPAAPIVLAGLSDGTPYAVRLRLTNAAGPGLASASIHATPGVGPITPVGLAVSDIEGDLVTLTWEPPPVGGAPESYVVEGGLVPGQTLAALDVRSAMPVFSIRLPAGTSLYVRVRAVILGRTTGASNEVRVSLGVSTPPSAPAHLLGLVDGSAMALSWTNTFDGGLPTGLWLAVTGPVSGVLPLGHAETFQYPTVPPGTYTVRVVAVNAAGVSPPSNAVTLSFPGACSGPPEVPLRLRAMVDGTTVSLRWSAPESGTAVTGYRLLVGTPGAPVLAQDLSGPVPNYGFTVPVSARHVSGTVPPDYYSFFLSAVNACGSSPSTGPLGVWVR